MSQISSPTYESYRALRMKTPANKATTEDNRKAIKELQQLVFTRIGSSLAKRTGSPVLKFKEACPEQNSSNSNFLTESTIEKNSDMLNTHSEISIVCELNQYSQQDILLHSPTESRIDCKMSPKPKQQLLKKFPIKKKPPQTPISTKDLNTLRSPKSRPASNSNRHTTPNLPLQKFIQKFQKLQQQFAKSNFIKNPAKLNTMFSKLAQSLKQEL